jgi:nucleoid-associated protein YgaU
MYAVGYGIHPLRSRRRRVALGHAGRPTLVLFLVAAALIGLARVAFSGATPGDTTVVVQPGDTLWTIAAAHYPSDDVRTRVDDIERVNGLHSPVIEVGETLRLPA